MAFGTKKTRMAWLPDGEKFLKISLFVFTKCTNVTDRHTDRHRHRMTAKAALDASIAPQKQYSFESVTELLRCQ